MDDPLWVFGYGSLIWDPGFPVAERSVARLNGYHRSFCMWSIHHRGTQETPGLVLALDEAQGASCQGVALRAQDGHGAATLDYLRERELISSAYLETRRAVRLTDGRSVEAVTFVIDPHHAQYCGDLDLERQAEIIAHAHGGRGPNTEYLNSTASYLRELGISDADMDWLVGRVATILK